MCDKKMTFTTLLGVALLLSFPCTRALIVHANNASPTKLFTRSGLGGIHFQTRNPFGQLPRLQRRTDDRLSYGYLQALWGGRHEDEEPGSPNSDKTVTSRHVHDENVKKKTFMTAETLMTRWNKWKDDSNKRHQYCMDTANPVANELLGLKKEFKVEEMLNYIERSRGKSGAKEPTEGTGAGTKKGPATAKVQATISQKEIFEKYQLLIQRYLGQVARYYFRKEAITLWYKVLFKFLNEDLLEIYDGVKPASERGGPLKLPDEYSSASAIIKNAFRHLSNLFEIEPPMD